MCAEEHMPDIHDEIEQALGEQTVEQQGETVLYASAHVVVLFLGSSSTSER
jgi:hypothetical protein